MTAKRTLNKQEIDARFETVGIHLRGCDECTWTFPTNERVCPNCGLDQAPIFWERAKNPELLLRALRGE